MLARLAICLALTGIPIVAHAQVPAEVVYGPVDPRAASVYAQNRETRADVRAAVKSGQMSQRDGRDYRWQSRHIDALAAGYARDGLSPGEARELEMRSRALDSIANAPASRIHQPAPERKAPEREEKKEPERKPQLMDMLRNKR